MRANRIALAAALLAGCGGSHVDMNQVADRYVRLVLAVGVHDPAYVDAYYGPPEWKDEAAKEKLPLDVILQRAADAVSLIDRANPAPPPDKALDQLRRHFLRKQLQSLIGRVRQLQGHKMTFDEESAALYDAVAPDKPQDYYAERLARLGTILPGSGEMAGRVEAFEKDFRIPRDRLDSVFRAAIAEARTRTRRHIRLPQEENFRVEYVTNQVWTAYNWYQGDYQSLIQVNTSLPIDIKTIIRLACHEGYPGHHVYNVLLEDRLSRHLGWGEFRVYPLFSPQSLIAEGSADYGVDLVLPSAGQIEFMKQTLFPMAGLDPSKVELYDEVMRLVEDVRYAGIEIGRAFLDGKQNEEQTVAQLVSRALYTPDRARQRIEFMRKNRSYIINYNYGKELVARYMNGAGNEPWEAFERLLSSPMTASNLQ